MNKASQLRLDLAREIIPFYAASPQVEAILLMGSVSRGIADSYSDIEFGIFWSDIPCEANRKEIAERVGGSDWQASPYDPQTQVWGEEFRTQNIKFDLGHWTVSAIADIIADVTERYDIALPKQTSLAAIQASIPLHGEEQIGDWSKKIALYPEPLAAAMIKQYLDFSPFWMTKMLAERDDWLLLRTNLCAVERKLFLVFLALNSLYYPGHKWVNHHIRAMEIAPCDFLFRLKRILTDEPLKAVEEMRRLIDSTFELIRSHRPGFDVVAAEQRFNEIPPCGPE
jgi:hypothetical protein